MSLLRAERDAVKLPRLERFAHKKGEHQIMLRRIFDHVHEQTDSAVVCIVLATDLNLIEAAVKRGEPGDWQELFREILSGVRIA